MSKLRALFDLNGLVALVAGGTRGIGRAIAELYVDLGGHGTIASRSATDCDALAQHLNALAGAPVAWGHAFNLSAPQEIDALVAASVRHWGQLDTLFANSYRAIAGSAARTSDEDFEAALRDNIVRNSRLAHSSLPALTAARGSVVFIASASGLAPSPSMAAYGIAKRGLIQLMQNLAVEWGPRGVRVNAVAPGMTRTPTVTQYISPDSLAERVKGLPIARLGEPQEIAAAAVFLAAPAAGFITGHTLVADGGRTLLSGNTSGALDFD